MIQMRNKWEKFHIDDALQPIVYMSFEHKLDGASGCLSFLSGDERKSKIMQL